MYSKLHWDRPMSREATNATIATRLMNSDQPVRRFKIICAQEKHVGTSTRLENRLRRNNSFRHQRNCFFDIS